ncbi:MAG: VWA domain-containing protein [Alteromonadaceae bacterium]|nr:VWA domain-containing protein [Alteromonadaceae bacterium]
MTCASLLSVAVSLSSWASDLDIYLGSGNDTVTYKPNVLFIIDTSGSMSNQDGTGKTRLLRVQQALNEALSGATNINAGLMRFSNKGGSILHPVTDIDRFVPPQLIDTVQSGADDATSINGEMQISTNQLQIARGTQTVTTGLRFVELNIPQGAQITKASLRFASAFSNTEPVDIKIYGELNGDAQNYAVGAAVHERAKTTHFVEWNSDNTFSFSGEYISTPDITSVIQEVVNQPSWCGRNNIGLIIAATGLNAGVSRAAYAFEQGNGLAPQLVIEYDDTTATGCVAGTMTYRITSQDENAEERGNGHQSTGSEFTFQNTSNEHIPSPASYLPPVTDLQCQTNNHIVLLSDGEANNNHSVSKIQSLLGKTCQSSSSEHCGLDLVRELSQTNTSPLNARVITHTIGFVANATANNFLNQLALNGGGGFYQTDNSEELVDVFQQILRTVKDINATFVSPGVAVNQLNPLTHRDELYFALFKPSEGTLWPGNLKQYKIQGNTILDQNNANAVDGSTGFFSEYAHSFWSTLADGNAVGEGGAASKLGLSRNIYTFSTPGNIVAPENQLHEDNTSINTRDLALGSLPEPDTLRTKVLKWARGVDVRDYDGDGNVTEARRQMGAPIHSQPVIVNYGTDDSAILVATNHGFLHSFDTTTGAENFAVIPRELLSNLYDFYQDGSSFNHIYGLDGSLVLRRVGDKTYLYVGMRRGGQNYYAFDISEKDNPKLVFKIKGGEADFTQLGQTWSQPTLTKIKISDTIRDVMIIGGGYDDSQDDKLLRAPDSQGNAIYIVDANTGAKILTISQSTSDLNVATMLYGIPGRISSVDRDNDGLVDHLYAADMGGQLFRFDIYNGEVGTDLIKGQRIADLGGDDESNHRRFVYGPDVTEVIGQGKPYFAITIGSGHRADPLGLTIDDRFYMLRDEGVFKRDEYGRFRFFDSVLSESDLYDATEHLLNSSDNLAQEHAKSELNSKNGWRFSLTRNGEKVLSSPLLLDYQIFFTTYTPSAGSDSLCASPTGHSRAYLIDLFTANAVTDLDRDKTIDVYDRSAQLSQTGIAPDPKMLIENIVTPVICIGAECESAVFEYDNDGNEIECQGEFACLVRNIYGRFKRVQQQSWRTDIERQ